MSTATTQLSNAIAKPSKWTTLVAIGLFMFLTTAPEARAAISAPCGVGPVVKNLMALKKPACEVRANVPQELSNREIKRLSATAGSIEDHLKLAHYYNTLAARFDAKADANETAAAAYRSGPTVKNLMAPVPAATFEYSAKKLRAEARTNHELAVSHERLAQVITASR